MPFLALGNVLVDVDSRFYLFIGVVVIVDELIKGCELREWMFMGGEELVIGGFEMEGRGIEFGGGVLDGGFGEVGEGGCLHFLYNFYVGFKRVVKYLLLMCF